MAQADQEANKKAYLEIGLDEFLAIDVYRK
jgi:hypothetical protein